MKAKDVLKKYDITRRTLTNWVKRGIIQVEKTPSGRYIYFEKSNSENKKNN
jgi:predicted site-specific integrase-resolvase